jgi:hypothetical protein
MFKKNKNIFILGISIVLSLIGGLLVYYTKQDEIERLTIKIKQLNHENKQLQLKLNKYSETLSTV